jgi:hypothetical protein
MMKWPASSALSEGKPALDLMSWSMFAFQFRTELDPVAVVAVVIATAAFILTFYQWWRSGPRLVGKASPNMRMAPDPKKGIYLHANVSNRGSRRTIVTGIGFVSFPSIFQWLRNKPTEAFVIPSPLHVTLPRVLEPGDYFFAGIDQTASIVERSKKTRMYFEIYFSDRERPLRLRVKPIKVREPKVQAVKQINDPL